MAASSILASSAFAVGKDDVLPSAFLVVVGAECWASAWLTRKEKMIVAFFHLKVLWRLTIVESTMSLS